MRQVLKQDADETAEPGEDARYRFCAVTRERLPIEALIRFVEGPEGQIVPDLRTKLPGRGVWVSLARSRLTEAIASKAFQRGLKRPVQVDAGLPVLVDNLLLKYALDALSFANKAGSLILGYERVLQTIAEHKAMRLFHASDAGADGVAKLDSKYRMAASQGEMVTVPPSSIDCFSIAQLSLALGRSNVVHGALIDAPASRNFIEQTGRLMRYRSS